MVSVGGGGLVKLGGGGGGGDDELLETCGEGGKQARLCSHRKIWPFDLEKPAPA